MSQKRTTPLQAPSIEKHHCTVDVRFDKLGMVPFDFGPVIHAEDHALETGSLKELRDLIVSEFEAGLHAYFDEMMEVKEFGPNNVQEGRDFVHKYVEFMHYAEPVYNAVKAERATTHNH